MRRSDKEEDMPGIAGESIDRLCTVEMRLEGMHRGIIARLYDAARRKQGAPLTLLASQKLLEQISPGDYVILMTGSGRPPWRPKGETDGPPGTASLARALKLGLGARPVYIAGEPYLDPLLACSESLGLTPVHDRERAEYDGFYPTALARPFPLGREGVDTLAKEILDELKPRAVISIESLCPNEHGVIHSATGVEREAEYVAHTYHLITEAKTRGILTIGIGDFGNEVGYGLIREEIRSFHPYGSQCQCPCGGSGLASIATDLVVHGAISNWAAYGVGACLALLKKDMTLLQDAETEERMIRACVDAGADGGHGFRQPWVDNTSLETQKAVVTMLRMIVENALKPAARRPF